MKILLACFLLAYLFSLPGLLPAQSSTGEIVGQALDESGAAVPNAKVVIRNSETGETRELSTDASGNYVVTQLIPGTYEITVEASGFRRFVRTGLTLQVGQRAKVDVPLRVGTVTESVEVVAEPPLLEATEASLGQVVENRKILELPLNGRNILGLTALTTGVTPGNSFGVGIPDGRAALIQAASANILINGGMTAHNDAMIDGVPLAVCCQNQISFQPSIDTTREFRVRTSMYDAQYGRTGGGIISFATKSGTNAYHGSVFHFLRNDNLDANNFFNNRAGVKKGHFVYNQFGGQMGGPIARNKLFFFANYEGVRNVRGAFSSGRTPSESERNGLFSVAIYDPLTGTPANNYTRTAFPNNQVPPSRFDPVSVKLIPLWPQANTTGQDNFISNAPNIDNEDQVNIRLDYHLSDTHRLFGRFSTNANDALLPDTYGNIASVGWNQEINNYNGVLDDTWTISPSLILNVRYGFTRQRNFRIAFSTGTDLTAYGWPASYSRARQAPLLPEIRLTGMLQLSRSTLFERAGQTHAIAGSVTKIAGRHFLKFGTDFRAYQANWGDNGNASGQFNFDVGFTRGPDALRGAGGSPFASFLLGFPGSGSINYVDKFSATSLYDALYIQDDIRIGGKLTLNVGLRWDVEMPRDERYNRLSYFDRLAPSPIASAAGMPNLTGGLRFLGVNGRSRQQDTDWNNFGPRLGFAWQGLPRTVIRGGYGITYLPIQTRYQNNSNQGFATSTSVVASLDGGRTPAARFNNPFPGDFAQVQGSAPGLRSSLGQSFGTLLREEKAVGYAQQWSFDIQQELTADLLFDIAYSGSKGTRLPMPIALNQLATSYLSLGDQLLRTVNNPFAPFVEAGALSQPTTTARQLLLPFPHFLGLTSNVSQLGSSSYHALQMKLNKRFSKGFSVLGAYTLGKILTDTSGWGVSFLDAAPGFQDTYNRRLDRAVAPEDISSRLVISYVWELPVGRGQAFLSDAPRGVDLLLGGWQINGITTFSTGQPIVLGNSVPTTSGASRPHNLGRSARKSGRIQDRLSEYFDRSAFSAPGPFEFGSAPRTLPDLRADGPHNFDVSFFKNFALTERLKFQFRAEFFNLFNSPQFGAPGSNLGTPQFGVITSQRNVPRDLQLALRLTF